MKHRISAGVIIEQADRVLAVRCVKPGAYDFWVAPGGGVQGSESLREAAQREVREETALLVDPVALAYIEELVSPEVRFCKFWFTGIVKGGMLSVAAPEAKTEFITEAAWLSRLELQQRQVFPRVLTDRYWHDRKAGFRVPVHLELRHMEFW